MAVLARGPSLVEASPDQPGRRSPYASVVLLDPRSGKAYNGGEA